MAVFTAFPPNPVGSSAGLNRSGIPPKNRREFPLASAEKRNAAIPTQNCADPEFTPQLPPITAVVADPPEGALRVDPLYQVADGGKVELSPFADHGGLVTRESTQLANSAFIFGAQRGRKFRAVGDL